MIKLQALFQDSKDNQEKAENVDLVILSGGAELYGCLLRAGGKKDELHPLILMLHGFPGHEKNLDLAQALRRIGFHVAYFSYRGSWGSRGAYAISHLPQDTNAVLTYLYSNAEKFGIDVSNLWLVGHSLGGFTALHTLSAPAVPLRGAVLIAPCDLGMMFQKQRDRFTELIVPEDTTEGCLHVPYNGALQKEAEENASRWPFSVLPDLSKYSMLFVGGSEDEVTPPERHCKPLLSQYSGKNDICYKEFADGHAFANSRIALARTLGEWLAERAQ